MASFLAVVVSLVLATMVSAARQRPPYQSAPAPYNLPPPPPVTTNKPSNYKTEPYKKEPYKTEPYKKEPYKTEPYKTEPYKAPADYAARSYSSQYNSPYQDGSYNEYQRDGYNQQPYDYPPFLAKSPSRFDNDDDENDVVDRMFAAADSLYSQLELAAESIANKDSQESLQTKQITQLTALDLPNFEKKNMAQDQLLEALEKKLDMLEKRLDELKATVDKVEYLNAENTKEIKELDIALAKQQYIDTKQVGEIASLLSAAQSVETKLLLIVMNYFTSLGNDLKDVVELSNANRRQDKSRTCETGVTTLTNADRRNVILFNSDFGQSVPQVVYGIVRFRYGFEVEERMKYSQSGYGSPYNYAQYGGSYGPSYPQSGHYPYRSQEAGSVGDLVYVIATAEGLTVVATNQSFDDAKMTEMVVNWQACSIGPGAKLA